MATWVQVYSIYKLVLSSHHPSSTSEIIAYQLLIVQHSKKFEYPSWSQCDIEFHQWGAANQYTKSVISTINMPRICEDMLAHLIHQHLELAAHLAINQPVWSRLQVHSQICLLPRWTPCYILPQQARLILPNLWTTVILPALHSYIKQWQHLIIFSAHIITYPHDFMTMLVLWLSTELKLYNTAD